MNEEKETKKEQVLEIKNLHVHYLIESGTVKAVNGIDLSIGEGESLGLVGETGAGKTTTCMAVMQLIPDPPGVIVDGEILFKGENMIYNTEKRNEEIRGNGISMIFQDPMTALNPIMTVGEQLMEVVTTHENVSKKEAREKVIETLKMVGIKSDRFDDYPHQFSGGQKQRVVISMALLCNPSLLIADEPTTALDVTIQAQVLAMMSDLKHRLGTSMLMITHDLGIVAQTCDDVAVMYAGEIIEAGTVEDIFLNEQHHPYTTGLFQSIPDINKKSDRLKPIPGLMADPANLPKGCAFAPRCGQCREICTKEHPVLTAWGTHQLRCHLFASSEKEQERGAE